MNKAVYIGVTRDKNPRDAWKHTELWYEYRGHTYCVVKDNNGYMGKTLRAQHEEEQRKIDEKISHENDPIPMQGYMGSAQEGFDLFWKYVEGNEQ